MILEFLADGFEEIEALLPLDVLRRSKCDIKTVAVGKAEGDLTVHGAHGINVLADISSDEALRIAKEEKLELVILPGGMPGAENLDSDQTVDRILAKASCDGAYLSAICAAPMVLGKRGYLRGKRATSYPGFEKYLDGAVLSGERVAHDGNVVTACGMGAAEEFAFTLLKLMKGEKEAQRVYTSILAK